MKFCKDVFLTAFAVSYVDTRQPKPRTVHTETVVLDGGRIIEDGTYEELLAKNGFFAELVARQRVE